MATPPDFTAGQVLTAAQMNKVGSWLISETAIGSAVSSVTVTDCFSADFDTYRIVIRIDDCSANTNLNMILGSTVTGYYWSKEGADFDGTEGSYTGGQNDSSFEIGTAGVNGALVDVTIADPFATTYTVFTSRGIYMRDAGGQKNCGGWLNDSTSYTSFTISPDSGTFTGGYILVYGMRGA